MKNKICLHLKISTVLFILINSLSSVAPAAPACNEVFFNSGDIVLVLGKHSITHLIHKTDIGNIVSIAKTGALYGKEKLIQKGLYRGDNGGKREVYLSLVSKKTIDSDKLGLFASSNETEVSSAVLIFDNTKIQEAQHVSFSWWGGAYLDSYSARPTESAKFDNLIKLIADSGSPNEVIIQDATSLSGLKNILVHPSAKDELLQQLIGIPSPDSRSWSEIVVDAI